MLGLLALHRRRLVLLLLLRVHHLLARAGAAAIGPAAGEGRQPAVLGLALLLEGCGGGVVAW